MQVEVMGHQVDIGSATLKTDVLAREIARGMQDGDASGPFVYRGGRNVEYIQNDRSLGIREIPEAMWGRFVAQFFAHRAMV